MMVTRMQIGGFEAVVRFDGEIKMYRGEIAVPEGGADFYAVTLEELRKEGETSLKVLLEFADEKGVTLSR